jgi:hypothetical protein
MSVDGRLSNAQFRCNPHGGQACLDPFRHLKFAGANDRIARFQVCLDLLDRTDHGAEIVGLALCAIEARLQCRHENTLRPFAMYRGDESMNPRPDQDAMLGEWKKAFTSKIISPNGTLEPEADFSTPRIIGHVRKRRSTCNANRRSGRPNRHEERIDLTFQALTLRRKRLGR